MPVLPSILAILREARSAGARVAIGDRLLPFSTVWRIAGGLTSAALRFAMNAVALVWPDFLAGLISAAKDRSPALNNPYSASPSSAPPCEDSPSRAPPSSLSFSSPSPPPVESAAKQKTTGAESTKDAEMSRDSGTAPQEVHSTTGEVEEETQPSPLPTMQVSVAPPQAKPRRAARLRPLYDTYRLSGWGDLFLLLDLAYYYLEPRYCARKLIVDIPTTEEEPEGVIDDDFLELFYYLERLQHLEVGSGCKRLFDLLLSPDLDPPVFFQHLVSLTLHAPPPSSVICGAGAADAFSPSRLASLSRFPHLVDLTLQSSLSLPSAEALTSGTTTPPRLSKKLRRRYFLSQVKHLSLVAPAVACPAWVATLANAFPQFERMTLAGPAGLDGDEVLPPLFRLLSEEKREKVQRVAVLSATGAAVYTPAVDAVGVKLGGKRWKAESVSLEEFARRGG
ncbi:hypothetical protein JCM10213v2_003522 [Rhodosporidiobolus nylandii]